MLHSRLEGCASRKPAIYLSAQAINARAETLKCPPGCHLCCIETEMALTWDDVKRIENLGFRRSEFSEFRGGFLRLRNVNGRCFFLGEKGCIIYEARPIGCRAYPVIYSEELGACILDPLCPAKETVSSDEFVEKCRLVLSALPNLIRSPEC